MSQAANQAGNDREHPLHASAVHTPAHAAPTFGIQSSRKTPRHSRGGALPPRMARLWTSSAACLCRMAPRRALPARLRWCVRLPTRLSASMPFAAHPHAAGTQTQGGGALAIGIERLSVSEQCGASTSTAYAVVTVGDSIVSMKGGGGGGRVSSVKAHGQAQSPPPPPLSSLETWRVIAVARCCCQLVHCAWRCVHERLAVAVARGACAQLVILRCCCCCCTAAGYGHAGQQGDGGREPGGRGRRAGCGGAVQR